MIKFHFIKLTPILFLAACSATSQTQDYQQPLPAVSDGEVNIFINHFRVNAAKNPPVFRDEAREAYIANMRALMAQAEADRDQRRENARRRWEEMQQAKRDGVPYQPSNNTTDNTIYRTGDYICPVDGLNDEMSAYYDLNLVEVESEGNTQAIDNAFFITIEIVKNSGFLKRLEAAFAGAALSSLKLKEHPAYTCLKDFSEAVSQLSEEELNKEGNSSKLATVLAVNDALLTLREQVYARDAELGGGRFDGYVIALINPTHKALPEFLISERDKILLQKQPVTVKTPVQIIDARLHSSPKTRFAHNNHGLRISYTYS